MSGDVVYTCSNCQVRATDGCAGCRDEFDDAAVPSVFVRKPCEGERHTFICPNCCDMQVWKSAEIYRTSPITSPITRRTKAEIAELERAIYIALAGQHPATNRWVFYQMVTAGMVEKTEQEYKGAICRLLVNMRRSGHLPYWWIADNSRLQRKPQTYSGLRQMLERTAETYRRALWDSSTSYVEVWLEKDALSGVLYPVTAGWDVPLMVTRGYASESFLWGAAETIKAMGKETYIYYLGDFDPSGVNIPQVVERGLRRMAPDIAIHFERLAVNEGQIEELHLPTRPTKSSDSRSKAFGTRSVEVDAIDPSTLRQMVKDAIEQHVDQRQIVQLELQERAERETLVELAARLPRGDAA